MIRNSIIALCAGYEFSKIAPFLISAREKCENATIHILTTNPSKKFLALCSYLDVIVEDVTLSLQLAREMGFYIETFRYYIYRDVIRRNPLAHRVVALSDPCDVIFQGNLFEKTLVNSVVCSSEQKLIKDCMINTNWVNSIYGREQIELIGNNKISCSGFTFGTAGGILDYLNLMCDEFDNHMEQRGLPGGDQGVHNFVIWNRRPNFVHVDLEEDFVATLGYRIRDSIQIHGEDIGIDGRFPPVIHQYDRHPDLAKMIVSTRGRLGV